MMKTRIKYFVCFFWVLSTFVPRSGQSVEIMAFGDSITQGLYDIQYTPHGARVGGYEPHLEYLFSLVGLSANVYNWGLGGESTGQALEGRKLVCEINPETGEEECSYVETRTIDSALAAQGSAHYMLLMEGTNDYFFNISPWTTATNIGIMIDKARAFGMEPIVGNLTPDLRGLPKQIESRNLHIALIAAEKGVALVDMYSGVYDNWENYVSSDNLHPNHSGYQAIARLWFMPFYNLQLDITGVDFFQDTPLSAKAVFVGTASANGKVFELGFDYGEDLSMGSNVIATPSQGDGVGGLSVTAEVSGLKFETEYYYRMTSRFDGETYYGPTKTFITPKRSVVLSWLSLLLLDE